MHAGLKVNFRLSWEMYLVKSIQFEEVCFYISNFNSYRIANTQASDIQLFLRRDYNFLESISDILIRDVFRPFVVLWEIHSRLWII